MKYKAIFSDFDGTISRSDNTVSEKVKRAIGKYVAAGGRFVLATGRLFSAAYPRALELGLHGKMIVYQGGGIFDIDRNSTFARTSPISTTSAIARARANMWTSFATSAAFPLIPRKCPFPIT